MSVVTTIFLRLPRMRVIPKNMVSLTHRYLLQLRLQLPSNQVFNHQPPLKFLIVTSPIQLPGSPVASSCAKNQGFHSSDSLNNDLLTYHSHRTRSRSQGFHSSDSLNFEPDSKPNVQPKKFLQERNENHGIISHL